jgi:hypothetical protein
MPTIEWTHLKKKTLTLTANKVDGAADNEAVLNTGHAAEHIVKEASDNLNAIQNANVSFNLL